MASTANFEVVIFEAVKAHLISALSDVVRRVYEGGRESLPHADFPALLLTVPMIELVERPSDHERLRMFLEVRFMAEMGNIQDVLTDSRFGMLRYFRRIDSAVWAGASQQPPFGVDDEDDGRNLYNLSVQRVGDVTFNVFEMEGFGWFRELLTTFQIEYVIVDSER